MLVETLPEKDCTKSSVLKCLTKKDLEEIKEDVEKSEEKEEKDISSPLMPDRTSSNIEDISSGSYPFKDTESYRDFK